MPNKARQKLLLPDLLLLSLDDGWIKMPNFTNTLKFIFSLLFFSIVALSFINCSSGNGGSGQIPNPIPVLHTPDLALGQDYSCAIVSGALKCWGYNNYGQLGDGTTTDKNTPVTVIGSGATQVALGAYHSCAMVSGALKCWGSNSTGQLGDGDSWRVFPILINLNP